MENPHTRQDCALSRPPRSDRNGPGRTPTRHGQRTHMTHDRRRCLRTLHGLVLEDGLILGV
ncbi:hypothetical protein BGY98DRAFT_982699 [Russula aff. rugulosa BPL654]|nr:hypothetical protein BGY98DRAFT_982699 [Russula aff. rugulosa BPL654]